MQCRFQHVCLGFKAQHCESDKRSIMKNKLAPSVSAFCFQTRSREGNQHFSVGYTSVRDTPSLNHILYVFRETAVDFVNIKIQTHAINCLSMDKKCWRFQMYRLHDNTYNNHQFNIKCYHLIQIQLSLYLHVYFQAKCFWNSGFHHCKYSQTCVKQPPKGSTENGCLRQVAA